MAGCLNDIGDRSLLGPDLALAAGLLLWLPLYMLLWLLLE